MNCNKENCPNKATHQVELELKANAKDVAATSTPVLFVCDEHKNVTLDSLFDSNGWNQIRQSFVEQGFFPPSRTYSKVIIKPMEKVQ